MSMHNSGDEVSAGASSTRKERTSSFLSRLISREKQQPGPRFPAMQSADDLPDALAEIRETALQVHLDFHSTAADLESRISKLSAHISDMLPVIVALHKAHGESEAVRPELEEQNADLSKALTEARDDLLDHKRKLAEVTSRANRLVEEREKVLGQNEIYQRDLLEIRRAKEDVGFQLETAQKRTQRLDQRLVELEDENIKLKDSYLDAKRSIAGLCNDLNEGKLELAARNDAYERARKSLEAEKASAARAKSELMCVNNDLQEMRAHVSNLETEAAAARARYESQIERMMAASAGLERDRDAVRARLAVVEKISSSQKRKLEQQQTHINHLQTHLRRVMKETGWIGEAGATVPLEATSEDLLDNEEHLVEDVIAAAPPVFAEDSVIKLPPRRK